jgi:uncharacterized protein YdhG (YjbR/CyaY superfamily)
MAKTVFKSVAGYIAAQPKPAQAALRQVRAAIRRALPTAEETISYNIPAYRLDGRAALYFASFKGHYSVYPASDALIAAVKDARGPHVIRNRTIRFPFDRQVPAALIARIAKLRAREQNARAKAKAAAKRR